MVSNNATTDYRKTMINKTRVIVRRPKVPVTNENVRNRNRKDYYVTMILRLLSQKLPFVVLKGGKSLSKCHKVIRRENKKQKRLQPI